MTAMAEQRQSTEFSDLVRERRRELNISLRDLALRSVDPVTKEQAKHAWIGKVENGTATSIPPASMLRALAVGLGLPSRIVQEAAAAQYWGMTAAVWSEDLTTRIIVARAEEMTDSDRRELADIAEIYARRRTQRDDDGHGNSGD